MVGAGRLIELPFGLDYLFAVTIVGVLMILYVATRAKITPIDQPP